MNPSIAASVLALALFAPVPQSTAQDRAASVAPIAAGVPVASDPAVRDALARLDVWLEGQRYRFDLPGFAVGVVHDQQLLWSKGYGYADVAQRIPSTDQTLYRIASIIPDRSMAALCGCNTVRGGAADYSSRGRCRCGGEDGRRERETRG